MGKRSVIWLGVLGAAIAVLIPVIALSSKEPRYARRPLSFWVNQLPATLVMTNGYSMAYPAAYATLAEAQADQARVQRVAVEARAAVKGLGSECLPSLLRRLNRSNSRFSGLALWWALRLHLLKLSSPLARSPDYIRGQALTALLELGDDARPAVPELVVLAQSKDPGVRLSARHALASLAPDELKRVRHE